MRFLRIVGVVLLVAAATALASDVVRSIHRGAVTFYALGEAWYQLHPQSLNLLQAGVQRYVAPWLWDPVIVSVLRLPALVALGVPGALALFVALRAKRS